MNHNEKTLVILTPGFPASETDFNCLPMQQALIRSLNKNNPGLNVIILSFQYPYFKKEYKWFGNTVISFSGRNKGGLPKLMLRKKINAKLKVINKKSDIAALLSFWCGECALAGKRFADKTGIKHYCWILGQDARIENKYVNKVQPRPDELIALSDFLQNEFEKNHLIRPAYVITPGIDPGSFSEKKQARDIDVLGVGSLIPLKQYPIFIEVIIELKKYFPGIKAILCGNGPEEKNLQTLCDKHELNDNILMTGEIPHREVLLLMQRSKVLLHPSSYEGYSGVCQEALYAGSHVVSFCRAMKKEIPQWHIVQTIEEMKQKTGEILQNQSTQYEKVQLFPMNESVNKMMELFNL